MTNRELAYRFLANVGEDKHYPDGSTFVKNKYLFPMAQIIREQMVALEQYEGISCQTGSSVSRYSLAAETLASTTAQLAALEKESGDG